MHEASSKNEGVLLPACADATSDRRQTGLGVGWYFIEVPWALPVGLHLTKVKTRVSKKQHSPAAITARNYNNNESADNFYFHIWGGEDIHIGIYELDDEDILTASRRTTKRMAALATGLNEETRLLDIGAGFGGPVRFLAKHYGCRIVALNISAVENRRFREMNEAQGLNGLIEVVEGSFEDLPYPSGSFDVIWSQDAILHSSNRTKVIEEVARVLKFNGVFIFTDIMQSDHCPQNVLQPILDRICLESLGSIQFYRETTQRFGLTEITFEDHSSQLVTHYSRILEETERREKELRVVISTEYIKNMKKGLCYWIEGGKNGHLKWGIFLFRKS